MERKKHINPNCQCASCKSKRGEAQGKNSSNYKDGRTLKKYYCKECEKEIHLTTALWGGGRCYRCALKKRKVLKGKKHPSYVHGKGYAPYLPEFNKKLKEKIRKRDNYKCQNCEMTQEEHYIVYKRNIEVHHIDYNKNNCGEDNLITLCKQCNLRANANRNYWKNYFRGY